MQEETNEFKILLQCVAICQSHFLLYVNSGWYDGLSALVQKTLNRKTRLVYCNSETTFLDVAKELSHHYNRHFRNNSGSRDVDNMNSVDGSLDNTSQWTPKTHNRHANSGNSIETTPKSYSGTPIKFSHSMSHNLSSRMKSFAVVRRGPSVVLNKVELTEKNIEKKFISDAYVLILRNFNLLSRRTQATVLETLKHRQFYYKSRMYELPMSFLCVATLSKPLELLKMKSNFRDQFLMYYMMGNTMDEPLLKKPDNSKLLETYIESPHTIENHLKDLIEQRKKVYVDISMKQYIRDLIVSCRQYPLIKTMPSPRTTNHFILACQAIAYVKNTSFVLPQHVTYIAPFILGHRIELEKLPTQITTHAEFIEYIIQLNHAIT